MKVRSGPDGIHFFDRASGLNVLLDEQIPPRLEWSVAPRQVSIALLNACDLACSHCYAPKSGAILSTSDVKNWMSELDRSGCFGVGFGGGEPTLHPGIEEICLFGQTETSLAMTMTTHGHHLTAELISSLSRSLNFIRLSMDGVRSTYEVVRRRSFDAFTERVKAVSEMLPFGINFVVNQTTIGDIEEAVSFGEKMGASEFLLLPEVSFGRGSKIDPNTLCKIKDWVKQYKGTMSLAVSSNFAEEFSCELPLAKESASEAYAHIDADARLKSNSFETEGVRIGDGGVIAALRAMNSRIEAFNV